jgi:hypothetical protein
MSNSIRQYFPAFVDTYEPERISFADLAGLLQIPWVHNFSTTDHFHRFSVSGPHLMAEYGEGTEWCCVGVLEHPVEGLPDWAPNDGSTRPVNESNVIVLDDFLLPQNHPQKEEPTAGVTEQEPAIYVLPLEHEHALLGHLVDPNRAPRFVYSLTRLAKKRQAQVPEQDMDQVREWVYSKVIMPVTAEFGQNAPVFIDDAISQEDAPIILTPGRLNGGR